MQKKLPNALTLLRKPRPREGKKLSVGSQSWFRLWLVQLSRTAQQGGAGLAGGFDRSNPCTPPGVAPKPKNSNTNNPLEQLKQSLGGRGEDGGITVPDFRLSYKAAVVGSARCWNRHPWTSDTAVSWPPSPLGQIVRDPGIRARVRVRVRVRNKGLAATFVSRLDYGHQNSSGSKAKPHQMKTHLRPSEGKQWGECAAYVYGGQKATAAWLLAHGRGTRGESRS